MFPTRRNGYKTTSEAALSGSFRWEKKIYLEQREINKMIRNSWHHSCWCARNTKARKKSLYICSFTHHCVCDDWVDICCTMCCWVCEDFFPVSALVRLYMDFWNPIPQWKYRVLYLVCQMQYYVCGIGFLPVWMQSVPQKWR